MKKQAIGILDMNIDNIAIIDYLMQNFPYENFIYVYDPECTQYEGLPEDEIKLRVNKNIKFLLEKQVKLIITVSSTIVEYCMDILNEISVPVVNIFDSIIDEVNNSFEHKNMILMATESVIQANLYQKKIRYNHLYSLQIESLLAIVREQKTKTAESFKATRTVLRGMGSKEIDLIVPTGVNLLLLKTEIKEYMPDAEILEAGLLLSEKAKAALLTIENLVHRGRGRTYLPQISRKQKPSFSKLLFNKRIVYAKKLKNSKTHDIITIE